ncbi:DUF599 domain-containing protein [Phenylobacterium sp.]|uniref:DUF599 domain-containing protein n=1 Tax=Phenylobacterium sp. TaxID=1871053 RepID=UPI002735B132|nr:DUF599 family protein [Phenylobacterium sp.]MDP3660332.1 DUF599 family protein [Phenylobacterium sp.]
MRIDVFGPENLAALGVFAVCWLGYQPLQRLLLRRRNTLHTDMTVIRGAWMRNMALRDNRFMDGQLLAQTLNSASFFASSNLLLIAAAAGVLFGGEATFRSASSLLVIKTSSRLLFEAQLALVIVALARGLLDFIWSIRQMNYCLAVMGAAPLTASAEQAEQYGAVAARLINPALSSFNSGVRGYYFALAAAAWLFGPIALGVASLGALVLLVWRQRRSPAASAIADLRKLLDG